MNIENAQKAVDEWIKNHGVRYFNELTNMAQLTEEVGKLLESLRDGMGNKAKKNPISPRIWERNSQMWYSLYSVWPTRQE